MSPPPCIIGSDAQAGDIREGMALSTTIVKGSIGQL
jgi:hypothetical protein